MNNIALTIDFGTSRTQGRLNGLDVLTNLKYPIELRL